MPDPLCDVPLPGTASSAGTAFSPRSIPPDEVSSRLLLSEPPYGSAGSVCFRSAAAERNAWGVGAIAAEGLSAVGGPSSPLAQMASTHRKARRGHFKDHRNTARRNSRCTAGGSGDSNITVVSRMAVRPVCGSAYQVVPSPPAQP